MIKVNLLESVTDRATGVAFVEDKVSSTRTQTFLLALTVVALLVLGVGYDYVSANAQHQAATKELEKQRRVNDQMNSVKREQADMEKKLAEITFRIDAIQKLRGSQQGPGGILAEVKARFDSVPGLYLKSVELKSVEHKDELTIKGESPNEAAVTRFGQSIEFSSGLFTNLNIETQRELAGLKTSGASAPAQGANPLAQPEIVSFTIKCNYSAGKSPDTSNAAASAPNTNHVAARN